MLVRCGVATMAFAGLLATPALAAAQAFTANPTGTLAGGYAASQTIPNDPNADPTVRSGPVATVGGALGLGYDTPRTTQTLQMNGSLVLPLTSDFTFQDRTPTYSVRFNYGNKIALTELTNLSLGVALSATPVNPFVSTDDAADTEIDTSPATFSYNLALSGHETLSRELSPNSSLSQSANVTYNFPFNVEPIRATTLHAKGSLAATRRWALDTGTLTLSVSYTHFGISESNTEPRPGQFMNTLLATWHRPLTTSLILSADLGVLQAASTEPASRPLWQPTGGARLTYDFDIAKAALGYTHSARLNVLTASINLVDQVSLRASMPLGATGLNLSTAVGYSRSTPITAEGTLASPTNVFLADAGLSYAPSFIPKLALSVRGTYGKQVADDDPLVGSARMSVSVHLAYAFPSARAAAAQSRIAPAYTPTPVLGSDSTPAPGVQPLPVELEPTLLEPEPEPEPEPVAAPPAEAP